MRVFLPDQNTRTQTRKASPSDESHRPRQVRRQIGVHQPDFKPIPPCLGPRRATRPSHFVAVRISHEGNAVRAIEAVQAEMRAQDASLSRTFVDAAAAHVTLCVVTLETDEIDAAREHFSALASDPGFSDLIVASGIPALQLSSLDSFGERILFASVGEGPGRDFLCALADMVRRHMREGPGGETMDARTFQPHVTVAKTSKAGQGGRRRDPGVWKGAAGVADIDSGLGVGLDPALLGEDEEGRQNKKETSEEDRLPTVRQATGKREKSAVDSSKAETRNAGGRQQDVWVRAPARIPRDSWAHAHWPALQISMPEVQLLSMRGRQHGGYYPVVASIPLCACAPLSSCQDV